MRAEFINPFIIAMDSVFDMMLGQKLRRGPLSLGDEHSAMYDVSGLIGLSGKYRGMVVLSFGRLTAISATEIMLGIKPSKINVEVMDAIGELTNMVAGSAKSQLEDLQLTIGLPTVICGKAQAVGFPSKIPPIVIPYESDMGPVCIQVGMVESA